MKYPEGTRFAEDTKPDLESILGKAWKFDVHDYTRKFGKGPNPSLTVSNWIVEARWAHPLWHSYMVLSYSLRPDPSAPPPRIYLPGATHEVIVYALDPDKMRPLNWHLSFLTPANFAAQYIASNDEEAGARIDVVVQEIVSGVLNPDTDGRAQWVERFGDNMIKQEWRDGPNTIIIADTEGNDVTIIGTEASAIKAMEALAKKDKPN